MPASTSYEIGLGIMEAIKRREADEQRERDRIEREPKFPATPILSRLDRAASRIMSTRLPFEQQP